MRSLYLSIALGVLSSGAAGSTPDLDPVARSERSSIVCRDGRRVVAEFSQDRHGVHLVTLHASSLDLAAADRAIIEGAARELGSLDRVQPACNGGGRQILLRVTGSLVEQGGRMWQRALVIVWDEKGVSGTGGRAAPVVELEPWRQRRFGIRNAMRNSGTFARDHARTAASAASPKTHWPIGRWRSFEFGSPPSEVRQFPPERRPR